jgi:hypothetical protein
VSISKKVFRNLEVFSLKFEENFTEIFTEIKLIEQKSLFFIIFIFNLIIHFESLVNVVLEFKTKSKHEFKKRHQLN